MKTLEQQILSCMTVRLTEQFPALAPAFSLLSFQESENMGTDGSCFYYEKTALRNAFLENRLDFLFLHSLTHMLFLHFLPEASVEQEVWNLAADLAASYFVDTYLLTESPEATERQKIYVKLPPGARSAKSFTLSWRGYQLKKGKAFLPARRMTTAAGFPRETMFLALLRGLVAQRLPIFSGNTF